MRHDVDVLTQHTLKIRQRHGYCYGILNCSAFSVVHYGCKKVLGRCSGRHCRVCAYDVDVLAQRTLKVRNGHGYRRGISSRV